MRRYFLTVLYPEPLETKYEYFEVQADTYLVKNDTIEFFLFDGEREVSVGCFALRHFVSVMDRERVNQMVEVPPDEE